MKDQRLSLQALKEKINGYARVVKPYSFVLFLLFVGSIYGFTLYKINSLSNAQPSSDAVSSQFQAAKIPRIDPQAVAKLKSLQDNSVSVQTLFDQARSNPFQQ